MTQPGFPGRTAPAANADVLGDDARNDGTVEGLPDEIGQDGTPRGRGQADEARERDPVGTGRERGSAGSGEARPGQDINQAGFLKDTDSKPGA